MLPMRPSPWLSTGSLHTNKKEYICLPLRNQFSPASSALHRLPLKNTSAIPTTVESAARLKVFCLLGKEAPVTGFAEVLPMEGTTAGPQPPCRVFMKVKGKPPFTLTPFLPHPFYLPENPPATLSSGPKPWSTLLISQLNVISI